MLSNEVKEDIVFLFKQEKYFADMTYDLYFQIRKYVRELGNCPFERSKYILEEFVFLFSYYETTVRERNENFEMIKIITGKEYGKMESLKNIP